jgi:dTDP-4-dehydrorhamnose reductase
MKVLVLGSAGQLGVELVGQAPRYGHEVVGLGHGDLDATDRGALEAALDSTGPAMLVNTTAFHVVPECEEDPERAFAVNAGAVKLMAEACNRRRIGFVTYSTDYVFDGAKGRPYTEEDAPHPLQTYGVSKYAGELLARLFHPECVVIRTCGVYGGPSGSRSKRGNFALNILREAASRRELEVSSEQIVNPTYAADLAAATFALLRRNPPAGLYHLASEGACSWAEFASAVVTLARKPLEIVPVDRGGNSGAARRPRFSALANVKAQALGVVLPHWKDGLRRYLESIAQPASP